MTRADRTYSVREVFHTIQGEGSQAGRAATFVRFTGCNAWSGREEDRARDHTRTGADCARWCDTDFVKGDRVGLTALVGRVLDVAMTHGTPSPLVVLTGGEPLLQVDAALVRALKRANLRVAIETNGSIAPDWMDELDHVTVSPKWLDGRWKLRRGTDLKVVVPAYDPARVLELVSEHGDPDLAFRHWFVQPQDGCNGAVAWATAYALGNPRWRLCLQVHKLIGLP